MGYAIALTDEQLGLVADLFDPPGRRGAPALIPRRQMVEAMLFISRTGIQWRYLPEPFPIWTAVWSQWRRWRANGVWAEAMRCLRSSSPTIHRHRSTGSAPRGRLRLQAITSPGPRAGLEPSS